MHALSCIQPQWFKVDIKEKEKNIKMVCWCSTRSGEDITKKPAFTEWRFEILGFAVWCYWLVICDYGSILILEWSMVPGKLLLGQMLLWQLLPTKYDP